MPRLGIAAENSGKLVSLVRQAAKDLAEKENRNIIIIDGPPGIGCPVIASIGGVDLVLAVTEPTLSGMHDLKRILEVAEHFGIKAYVCINKFDINPENTQLIADYCREKGHEVIGKIPYDPAVTKAMINGLSVVEYPCNGVTFEIKKIWECIERALR